MYFIENKKIFGLYYNLATFKSYYITFDRTYTANLIATIVRYKLSY